MPRPVSTVLSARAIDDVAAGWLARRQGGLTPAEEKDFQLWLAADSRHAAAWAEMEGAWRALTAPAVHGDAAAANRALAARARARSRRRAAGGALAGTTLAAVAFFFFSPSRPSTPASGGAPVVAAAPSIAPRPDVQALADGSRVDLNAGAEIAVEFSPGLRRVRLVRGEAFFTVAKDAARPFVVEAGGVAVRAVGTAFAVRFAPERVEVLVTEGRVAVAAPADLASGTVPSSTLRLSAGLRVAVPADTAPTAVGAEPVSPAEIEAALAWRGRRIEFSRTTLAEAAALFNARNRVQLALADPALERLRLDGIFWSDDPESFARLLATGFGVRVERRGDTLELHGR